MSACKKIFQKKLMFFVLLYVGFMAVFIGFSTLVAALPHTGYMETNFRKSAIILFKEGTYPRHMFVGVDNCTDALVLNIALGYQYSCNNPFSAAMQNIMHHKDPKNAFPEIELLPFANAPGDKDAFHTSNYNRYFWGLSPVLKLFHYFAALKTFYTIQGCIATALAFILFSMLHKRFGWMKAAIYLVLLLTTQFYVWFHSLFFTPAFLLGMLTLLFCLRTSGKFLSKYEIFFINGMLFAYFDLLTTPLLAVMIPALFIVDEDFNKTAGKVSDWIKIFAGYPFFWFIGYVTSWGGKLIIADIYSGKFFSSMVNVIQRTSCDGENVYTAQAYRWTGIISAFREFFQLNRFMFIAIVAILAAGVLVSLFRKRFNNPAVAAGYAVYALAPVVFMLIMTNHTIVHPWMTYRNIPLILVSLLMALGTILRKPDKTGE